MYLSPEQKLSEWFIDLNYLIKRDVGFAAGDILVTRGFPHSLGGIDYDSGVIEVQSLAFSGNYVGPTTDLHVHTCVFPKLEHVESINGISGSPVFVVRSVPIGLDYLFAGMIVRGNAERRLFRFVDCSIIFMALSRSLNTNG